MFEAVHAVARTIKHLPVKLRQTWEGQSYELATYRNGRNMQMKSWLQSIIDRYLQNWQVNCTRENKYNS